MGYGGIKIERPNVTYEIKFRCDGDHGEFLGLYSIGFFRDKDEIRGKLLGLCPWDFNPMYGSSKFILVEHPFTITDHDTTARDEYIQEAKDHAKEHKDSWYYRWSGDFDNMIVGRCRKSNN